MGLISRVSSRTYRMDPDIAKKIERNKLDALAKRRQKDIKKRKQVEPPPTKRQKLTSSSRPKSSLSLKLLTTETVQLTLSNSERLLVALLRNWVTAKFDNKASNFSSFVYTLPFSKL